MNQVLGVMTRAMGRIHRDAISGEGWSNLQEAFGTEMKVMSRDTASKCQPCSVEKRLERHCRGARDDYSRCN